MIAGTVVVVEGGGTYGTTGPTREPAAAVVEVEVPNELAMDVLEPERGSETVAGDVRTFEGVERRPPFTAVDCAVVGGVDVEVVGAGIGTDVGIEAIVVVGPLVASGAVFESLGAAVPRNVLGASPCATSPIATTAVTLTAVRRSASLLNRLLRSCRLGIGESPSVRAP